MKCTYMYIFEEKFKKSIFPQKVLIFMLFKRIIVRKVGKGGERCQYVGDNPALDL